MSGSLFDFGLYFFHNAEALIERGSGPYFYLPKMESHLEARLWNDVFNFAQDALGIPRGTIRATVLIETPAAFEMDEILYELRDHAAGPQRRPLGLHLQRHQDVPQPRRLHPARPRPGDDDRPFMRAYTQLLVKTCHKRGAHAIGGMAAFIPSAATRGQRDRSPRCARTRSAKPATASTAPGLPIPASCRSPIEIFDAVLGDAPTRRIDSATTSVADAAADRLRIRRHDH